MIRVDAGEYVRQLGNHVSSTHQPSMRSAGTVVTELLPFAYGQFGSLPGVA